MEGKTTKWNIGLLFLLAHLSHSGGWHLTEVFLDFFLTFSLTTCMHFVAVVRVKANIYGAVQ